MADDFEPEQGPFLSFLNWLDRPGQVVRNLIRGNPGAAGRQTLDFLGEIPDALLPGNLIPDATSKDDYVSPHALVGMSDDAPWYERVPTDIGLGILTDPLSLIGVGELKAGITGAGAVAREVAERAPRAGLKVGVPFVPSLQKTIDVGADVDPFRNAGRAYDALTPQPVQDWLAPIGRGIRSTFAAENLSPEAQAIRDGARAKQTAVGRAGMANVEQIIKGLSPEHDQQAFDLASNLKFGDDARSVDYMRAPEGESLLEPIDQQITRLQQRAPDFLGVAPEDLAAHPAYTAAEQALRHSGGQFDEDALNNVFSRPADAAPPASPRDYLQRSYTGMDEQAADDLALGRPAATKGRTLDPQGITEMLADSPGVSMNRSLSQSLAQRSEQDARLAMKAHIGKALVGDGFKLADEGANTKVKEALDALPNPEDRQVLSDMYNGLPPRSAPMAALAKLNRFFKPYVVFGAALPKIGSLVRNRTSGIAQVSAEPGAEGAIAAMANPAGIASDLTSAVMDGMGLGEHAQGQAFKDTRLIGDAYKTAGGRASVAEKSLRDAGRDDLADAMKYGVLDSFTGAEKLIGGIAKAGWQKYLQRVIDSPAIMFQAVEHQMRLRTFQKLLEDGKPPAEAAKITSNALYDYGTNSTKNRALRDVVPFAQWSAKAIPQQAAWIGRTPAVGIGLNGLYGQHGDDVTYPYLAEKSGFSLGHNPDGTLGYASGFGLPSDSLSMIPGLDGPRATGRELERNWVASTQPLLKSAYSAVSGRDPYFGTASFSYDNVPLLGHEGAAGRAYQAITGAGLNPAAPALSELAAMGKGLSGEHSLAVTALDLLTGTNVVDVDQDRALQQMLQNKLALDPNVQHYDSLYSGSDDPETRDLLNQYQRLSSDIKKKRKAAKEAASL